ncbi:MAG: hypothetical protein A3G49_02045 [Candidatus Sungbacteria bacterium RIFCSPLOWO2_12_FULL_41_11]|uniref:UDP-N-acetylmuramoylalanine--D-glutamate ligase n=1 Tax=Candidatus Sungbacteria bacterium RIFCSPLOWO2_12_FULL_41_11 TaxID=1802286 RepID=A0A1G2LRW6_9BACT|nr:MAG: UDP-N-acetylmuramoylalanine-D-glutamate ligase [Parcubacteria group bacterium GW2011_GWA2_42_14]OHA00101.1 MAG: hypothetical protein A3D41_00510 [Candidatus Sungbacteria bacterium RIFCSPHIGHO2_02_FULL_41_12b]OHA14385.1 MAG: hypothetical protein A3G49_02045 [Candidatus Sungbacteria bacterium RIFCSPLOWO2_12_FULL_41_11]
MSQDFRNKKIVIMGLGLNDGGAGTTRFFLRRGADVLVTDLKSKKELWPSIKKLLVFKKECGKKCGRLRFILGRHRKNDFKDADLVIQGPGVPDNSPFLAYAVKNKIPIDTDIGIFFARCPAPIIGVTGSKGKSTTAALIYNILKRKYKDAIFAGNIGKSPLDYVDRIKPTTKIVLELSSWQLEGLARHKKSPHIAVITNILKEHLNRYKNFTAYAKAKALIFKFQKSGDYLIINKDAKIFLRSFLKKAKPRIIYSIRILAKSDFAIAGNIGMATAVAKLCGVAEHLIKKSISAFKGLPGRQEKIAEINGVSYYNDTTATMPDAAVLALNSIKPVKRGKIILIAGGTDKKLDFGEMAREIKKLAGVLILLPGDATKKLISNFQNLPYRRIPGLHPSEAKTFASNSISKQTNFKMFEVSSMKEVVRIAYSNAKMGDVVILSPGAASFGLFQNEFDRGEQFEKEVMKIKHKT